MLSLVVAAKRIAMLKRWTLILIIAVTSSILSSVSNAIVPEHLSVQSEVPASRLAHLRHGINLSHWAAKYHVALTCNEFGTFRNFAPAVDRAAWIRDMRIALEKYGIGWTMWDYAGGFGVVNKQNGHATPDTEVVKALGLAAKK